MKTKLIKYSFLGFLFLLGYIIFIICVWSSNTFNVGLDEIIFTITSPMKGADTNLVYDALKFCLPRIGVILLCAVILIMAIERIKNETTINIEIAKKNIFLNCKKLFVRFAVFLCILSLINSVLFVNKTYSLFDFIKTQVVSSTLYEDYYVDPNEVNIVLSNNVDKPKNLLYICLESMETSYASVEEGGKQEVSYIPNLVSLAKNNISFSNTEKIGGYNNTDGNGYTIGALMSLTSGVPFSFPIHCNDMGERQIFAAGLTNLGDILEEKGYNQEFLCGSDSGFAGRDLYFTQHGNYKIFDLYTARDLGYIDNDYYNGFWGYEDSYLYEIAKDELLSLAEQDEPFNFMMLTVDTHNISGYVCSLCENEYDMQLKNIVKCADKQLASFIEWCESQSFYEDTVIIITGDHPRMDTDLVEGLSYEERTIYNCFINCELTESTVTNNRIFTPMDIFPTTMYLLGFEWGGNRLGLGTNLFSSEKTLAEEMGYETFNEELAKKSAYYLANFS